MTLALFSTWSCSDEELGTVSPEISVTPEAIDLGDTPIGARGTHRVEITNKGAGVLSVESIAMVDEEGVARSADLAVSIEEQLPKKLPTSAKMSFEVQHIPRDDELDIGVVRVTSDDPARPKVDIPIMQGPIGAPKVIAVPDVANADIEADTPGGVSSTVVAVNFGVVALGARRSQTLFIVNAGTGNVPLHVQSVALVDVVSSIGLDEDSMPDPATSRVLLPLLGSKSRAAMTRSVRIDVAWTPASAGAILAATLRITTNDPARRELDIPINGGSNQQDPPMLRLDPANGVDFGNVAVGGTRPRMFTAHNDGLGTLVIQPLSLAVAGDFALIDPPVQISIPGGGMHTFGVRFSPTIIPPQSTTVRIASNDPTRPQIDYPLNGTGVMACVPAVPDPGEPLNDVCTTGLQRGQITLQGGGTEMDVTNTAMLFASQDEDWVRYSITVSEGCFLVGYDLRARATLPSGEQAEVCLHAGSDCNVPDYENCSSSANAQLFISPITQGDALCDQYANNIPIFVRVRHMSGEPTCMPYTLTFTAR